MRGGFNLDLNILFNLGAQSAKAAKIHDVVETFHLIRKLRVQQVRLMIVINQTWSLSVETES